MYASIVVGTDGSSSAATAVTHAAMLAAMSGAHLHIATTAPRIPIVASPAAIVDLSGWGEASEETVRAALESATALAEEAGATSTTHALSGDPADALLSLCEEVDAELLVVGNRGMHGLGRFLLGSVSSRCAHHADRSVLIVQTT